MTIVALVLVVTVAVAMEEEGVVGDQDSMTGEVGVVVEGVGSEMVVVPVVTIPAWSTDHHLSF